MQENNPIFPPSTTVKVHQNRQYLNGYYTKYYVLSFDNAAQALQACQWIMREWHHAHTSSPVQKADGRYHFTLESKGNEWTTAEKPSLYDIAKYISGPTRSPDMGAFLSLIGSAHREENTLLARFKTVTDSAANAYEAQRSTISRWLWRFYCDTEMKWAKELLRADNTLDDIVFTMRRIKHRIPTGSLWAELEKNAELMELFADAEKGLPQEQRPFSIFKPKISDFRLLLICVSTAGIFLSLFSAAAMFFTVIVDSGALLGLAISGSGLVLSTILRIIVQLSSEIEPALQPPGGAQIGSASHVPYQPPSNGPICAAQPFLISTDSLNGERGLSIN